MALTPHNVFTAFSLLFALGLTGYGLVKRGRTLAEKQRQRSNVFLGVALMLMSNVWEHLGFSEPVQVGLSMVGLVLMVLGAVIALRVSRAPANDGAGPAT